MSANPSLYDYIRDLRFEEDGRVEMVKGAGQRIDIVARGRYLVEKKDEERFVVSFQQMQEINVYQKDLVIREITDFAVVFRQEWGCFPFREQVVWRVTEENHPSLLFSSRYLFEDDPFFFGQGDSMEKLREMILQEKQENLYYLLESMPPASDNCIFYSFKEVLRMTWSEMQQKGITEEMLLAR
jgi:hypothetical protein